jgi:hypothetical protein
MKIKQNMFPKPAHYLHFVVFVTVKQGVVAVGVIFSLMVTWKCARIMRKL